MSATETCEKIINTTMELIKERKGDISNVTIRMIADRAGIGVGLTNHYFKSKELLVGECVDSVFKDLFTAFMGEDVLAGEVMTPVEQTKRAAKKVMHFLLDNEAVARVAMVSDVGHPGTEDYTTRLINSFAYCMADRKQLDEMLSNDRMSDRMKHQFKEHFISEQRIKAFMLTSSLKEAFIRKNHLFLTIGVDLNNPEKCDEYVDELVEMLM